MKLTRIIRMLAASMLVAFVALTEHRVSAVCGEPEWCQSDACETYCWCDVRGGFADWCSECNWTGGWSYVQSADVYGFPAPGEYCPVQSPCFFGFIANCIVFP